MVRSARQSTSLEQLLARPQDGRRHELVHGWQICEAPPGPRQGRVAATLAGLFFRHIEEQGGGVVLTGDTGFLLHRSPDTVRGPDVAYLTHAHYQAIDESAPVITGAPDLAIEILSPTSRWAEMHGKVADYLAAGATLVWVADPVQALIVSYRQLLSPEVLAGDDLLVADDLLPTFAVPVARVSRRP